MAASEHSYELIAPDTSVIIEGILSRRIAQGALSAETVLIHEAVLAELEHQANEGRAKGLVGLDEVERLSELAEGGAFEIRFDGNRPTAQQIEHAGIGEIDAMIRQLAYENGAIFFTADKVQARVAKAKGMHVHLVEQDFEVPELELESFFDEYTMSVHLREGAPPAAKTGKPGEWGFKTLDTKPLTRDDIKRISSQIIEAAGQMRDAFIEIERAGSTILQLGRYRTVITRPPFSDAWEITAVRPVKKLTLEDYKLSEKLKHRLASQAEGILIAGSPGMGKSTFAAALTEYYASKDKIVKTIEAPRDLVLPESITQYAISHGSQGEVHDILLLSRPDYTLFDEMRNVQDFALFADLRLSGIGLAGVIHATKAVDAIQRFIGKIELGMIPEIVDTVVFIRNGQVDTVLSLEMTVKVPAGMTEADLARPVVLVRNFETGESVYEMYTYGEQTVVIPTEGMDEEKSPAHLKLAADSVKDFFAVYSPMAEAVMTSSSRAQVYLPDKVISSVIGKGGSNITRIEEELGVKIDIKPLSEFKGSRSSAKGKERRDEAFDYTANKTNVTFFFDPVYRNRQAEFYVDGDFITAGQVGKDGKVKISKKSKQGKLIERAANKGKGLSVEFQ